MRRSLGVLAVLVILTIGCGGDDGGVAEQAATDEPAATDESAPYSDSPACESYIEFRDLIESNVGAGLDTDMEDYIIEAKTKIEQMEAVAEEASETLNSYRRSIDALVAPIEANGWKPLDIDAVPSEIVLVVEDTGFDAAEQQVWEWAAGVCGTAATNCRGFLAPLLYSPPLEGGGDLFYLIDPATCG